MFNYRRGNKKTKKKRQLANTNDAPLPDMGMTPFPYIASPLQF